LPTAALVRVARNLQTDSSEAIRTAALSGLGICHAPDWLLREELASGELTALLPVWRSRATPIHVVYPAHRKNVAKIDAFFTHISN